MKQLLAIILACLLAVPSYAALSASTIHEVRTTGTDTTNSGMFDPSKTAGMFTDLACTSATGNAPVCTSASYNFVAGDANAWLYVASGTNWTPGWYQITSVAANAATVNATIGQATLINMHVSTVAGIATVASPTTGTWTIDYSQQAMARFNYIDLASAGTGLTVSSAAFPFAKQQVGNCLVIVSGTNFNAGRYCIASVAAAVATVVGPGNITTGAGSSGLGGLGGAILTWGQLATDMTIAGMTAYVKGGTYPIFTGVSITQPASTTVLTRFIGYNAVRGDDGVGGLPILQANAAITALTDSGFQHLFANFVIDGNSATGTNGILESTANKYYFLNVLVKNFSGYCMTVGGVTVIDRSELFGCGTTAAITATSGTTTITRTYLHDSTVPGILVNGGLWQIVGNIFDSNSGASSDGINVNAGSLQGVIIGNTIYNNGRDGIRLNGGLGAPPSVFNNILSTNAGYGINVISGGTNDNYPQFDHNAYFNNTTGVRSGFAAEPTAITLTGDPFVGAAAGNFALNNTAGAGAAVRGTGNPGVFPGGLSTGYIDVGAVQAANSAVTVGRPFVQ